MFQICICRDLKYVFNNSSMKESSKYMFVNNSVERGSPGRPQISMFNSNPSLESRLQTSSVTSSYGLRSHQNVKPQPPTTHTLPASEQHKLMMRYVVVCMELERVNRLLDRNRIAKYNEEQARKELMGEFDIIKARESSQAKEISSMREEITRLTLRLKHLEDGNKEKDRLLGQKEEEMRGVRLELAGLNLSHSRLEHNQKNRMRELEGELVFQRNRISDLSRRKEELEEKLKSFNQKEQSLMASLANQQGKVRSLQDQLQTLRAFRTRSQSQNQISAHTTSTLRKQLDHLTKKLQQSKHQAQLLPQLQRRLLHLQSQNSDLLSKLSTSTTRIKSLQHDLSSLTLQLKTTKTNQGEALRRQFASLENKLQSINSGQERELVRERDMLMVKVEGLLAEIGKLQRLLAGREEDCKGCARLAAENGLLSRKLGALEQSLRERELEIQRIGMKPTEKVEKQQGQKMSVKDLLLSAQQLKGSNERMSRLIETSQELEGRSMTKVTSNRLISMKMYQ